VKDLRLNLALNNLTNKSTELSDVRGLSSASTITDSYIPARPQPGCVAGGGLLSLFFQPNWMAMRPFSQPFTTLHHAAV
jgi:hypothetical protein